jgi:methylmalonyl-CoA mutase cobalamin-binding subunit
LAIDAGRDPETAIEEDADVIGLSSLSGNHMILARGGETVEGEGMETR